jgi:NAD(P)-dependent dehydrogenase (short-subunit alcohol dehydrogenase family)
MSILVTGAGGALGSSVVRTLAARGHKVALVDRSAGAIEKLAAEVSGVFAVVDDASRESFAEALASCEASGGEPVSGAALVAGGWAGGRAAHEGDASLSDMLESNLRTVESAFAALLPGMVARRKGSLVLIGSRNVERPWAGKGSAAYTASKAAAVSYAQAVAAEVLEHGVRVNAILISTMDTPANRRGMPEVDPTTWVSTESAAGVVAFLLSDDARDISGAAIPVYGRA